MTITMRKKVSSKDEAEGAMAANLQTCVQAKSVPGLLRARRCSLAAVIRNLILTTFHHTEVGVARYFTWDQKGCHSILRTRSIALCSLSYPLLIRLSPPKRNI